MTYDLYIYNDETHTVVKRVETGFCDLQEAITYAMSYQVPPEFQHDNFMFMINHPLMGAQYKRDPCPPSKRNQWYRVELISDMLKVDRNVK